MSNEQWAMSYEQPRSRPVEARHLVRGALDALVRGRFWAGEAVRCVPAFERCKELPAADRCRLLAR